MKERGVFMVCPKCGTDVKPNTLFCPECGEKFAQDTKNKLPDKDDQKNKTKSTVTLVLILIATMVGGFIAYRYFAPGEKGIPAQPQITQADSNKKGVTPVPSNPINKVDTANNGYAKPGLRKKYDREKLGRTPAPETLTGSVERADFYIIDILPWNVGRDGVSVKQAIEWFGPPSEKEVVNNPTTRHIKLNWKDFIIIIGNATTDDELGAVHFLQWREPANLKTYRGIGIGDTKKKIIEKYKETYRSREWNGLEWITFTGDNPNQATGWKIGFGLDPKTQTVKCIYESLLPFGSTGLKFIE